MNPAENCPCFRRKSKYAFIILTFEFVTESHERDAVRDVSLRARFLLALKVYLCLCVCLYLTPLISQSLTHSQDGGAGQMLRNIEHNAVAGLLVCDTAESLGATLNKRK